MALTAPRATPAGGLLCAPARWAPRSLDALEALVDQAGRMMRRVIESSGEEELSREVSVRDREGRARASYTVGDIIEHLLVHSAEHRGQISDEVLPAVGASIKIFPGAI